MYNLDLTFRPIIDRRLSPFFLLYKTLTKSTSISRRWQTGSTYIDVITLNIDKRDRVYQHGLSSIAKRTVGPFVLHVLVWAQCR